MLLRRIALLTVALMTLAACGDDLTTTDPGPDPTTSTTTNQPSNLGPAEQIERAELVDDYGCGYGFAKGSADQTVGLELVWTAGFDQEPGVVEDPLIFPADGWEGRVITGTDLFSNWCDDVMEEGEPVPVTDSVWSLVAGTLTVTSDEPVTADGGLDVRATLTDAVIESADGRRVELADFGLHNSCWGCFAG